MARNRKEPMRNRLNEPPALTPEAQEQQNIALAVNCARQKLADGTASPQIIVHYLRLATEKEKLEREILELQKELIAAKTEAYQASKDVKELYEQAIKSMQIYSGNGEPEDYED